jgi:hypothetical protein
LNNAICITGHSLPANAQFQVLGQIKKKSITYGSVKDLWPKLADDVRAMGANAIVQAYDYQEVDWFAWSAPRVEGLAVRIEDLTLMDKLECQWY